MNPGGVPISRRALSTLARWREATPRERPEIAHYAGLSVTDLYALEQLTENLAACPEEEDWFLGRDTRRHPNERGLEEAVVPTLLHRLTLRPEDAHRLAIALGLATPGRTALVERALAQHLRGEGRTIGKQPPPPPVPVVPPPPAEPPPSAYARVLEALGAHAVNLAEPLPCGLRRQIAGRAQTSEDNVITCVSRARREHGCLLRARGGPR